ncbi:hypothetical protein BC829DRAFT_101438 [Chytridium lagenaria]|nr:hypothetical protein BC829DRAFT_101438 [Chytridium lagenaria]
MTVQLHCGIAISLEKQLKLNVGSVNSFVGAPVAEVNQDDRKVVPDGVVLIEEPFDVVSEENVDEAILDDKEMKNAPELRLRESFEISSTVTAPAAEQVESSSEPSKLSLRIDATPSFQLVDAPHSLFVPEPLITPSTPVDLISIRHVIETASAPDILAILEQMEQTTEQLITRSDGIVGYEEDDETTRSRVSSLSMSMRREGGGEFGESDGDGGGRGLEVVFEGFW